MLEYKDHPLNKRHNIDSLFSSLWEFYKKWFTSLFTISFVLSLFSAYFSSRIDISGLQDTTDPYAIFESIKSMFVPYLIIILFTLVANMIIQYWIIRKPIEPEGNIINFTGTVLVRFFLPLLVVNIVLGVFAFFALMAGIVVFIIGIFFAMFYVIIFFALAAPIMMIEETNIGITLSRIFKLVHKPFWPNMGWTVVFVLIIMVISIVLGAIIMIPFSGGFIRTMLNPESAVDLLNFASKPSFIILSAITNAVTMPLMPIFGLALYFNARAFEEGTGNIVSSNSGPTVEDLTP